MPHGRLSIVLALALLGGCKEQAPAPVASPAGEAQAPTPVVPVSGPERHIFAFGDSLFAGYGIGVEKSYPTRLAAALRARGINAVMTNAAVSGETSAAGAARLGFALDAQETPPDLVLLELGGNDMLRSLPPEQTRANFETMLGELKKRGIPVVIMGMRAPPNLGREYAEGFDAIYGDLAKKYGATLVPFWLGSIYQKPQLFQADRIHPTVEGVDILVANTVDQIAAAIPKAD